MQDEIFLRAWNAHRDYVHSIRSGIEQAKVGRPAAREPRSWLDRLAWAVRHA